MKLAFDTRKSVRPALVTGLLLLAINVGVYALVIRPRVQAYENLEGTRIEFEHELGTAEKRTRSFRKNLQRSKRPSRMTKKFHKTVLGTKQSRSIDIQREISEIATQFRIDPQSLSIQNKDLEDNGLENIEIELPLEGDYGDLRSFIARVESSKSFLIVDGIGLTGTKEGGLQLALNITVSSYFDAPWLKSLKNRGKAARRRA